MSLILSSSDERMLVDTKGYRPTLESHELVFIGSEEMQMDNFCNMVHKIVSGEMSVRADPFNIEYLNPALALQGKSDEFTISLDDFYIMAQYVLTNTDIYIPLDPRPGLFDWLQSQPIGDYGLVGDDTRDIFLRWCKEGSVVPGYNHGRVRLQF